MRLVANITGLTELDKTFSRMPRSTQRRAYTAALRAGAAIVRNLAEKNLKSAANKGYATGTAERSLRIYALKKYRGNFRVAVQVKKGMVNTKKIVNGKPVRVGLYVSVLEYGKSGQAPQSWIRKAIREGRNAAVSALTKEMGIRIESAVKDARL